MHVDHFKGFDRGTGRIILDASYDPDEGDCCGEFQIQPVPSLDGPLMLGEYSELAQTRYGFSYDEVSPPPIPSTDSRCFVDWAADVARNWEEFTLRQRLLTHKIAKDTFPGCDLAAEVSARI